MSGSGFAALAIRAILGKQDGSFVFVAEGTEITNTVAISDGACGPYYREVTVLVEALSTPHELYLPLILKAWPAVYAPAGVP